jgi:CheY-like chemotaxis protein
LPKLPPFSTGRSASPRAGFRSSDDIAREESADVLVIEDEPLIAAHLMAIVADAGHRPLAHATTATAAREAFERYRPALVLSDVQLADGSSGIDAVEDILRLAPVPVIFVTGYPEKLLTGEGPEPAFLIRKPFRDEAIHATISQALFFERDWQDEPQRTQSVRQDLFRAPITQVQDAPATASGTAGVEPSHQGLLRSGRQRADPDSFVSYGRPRPCCEEGGSLAEMTRGDRADGRLPTQGKHRPGSGPGRH